MNDLNRYVDVFLGCGGIDLPEPKGIAAKWRFIKGLAGNNTPAACLPFGKLTACAYSGGYSSGYGHIGVNTGEPLRKIMPEGAIRGFSHIHHSGTGFIDTFYNYAVIAPYTSGGAADAFEADLIVGESARPGYYAATMHKRGVKCELTVTRQAAHHRYTFPEAGGGIAIDFTNDGLLEERTRMAARDMKCAIISADTVACEVVLHNLKLFFCARCAGAKAALWEKGCAFEELPKGEVRLALGLSPFSMDVALEGAMQADMDFDNIASDAYGEWNAALGAIEIDAADERARRLFYSNLYHSLVKPSDWSGESFLYADERAFILDFATLWDQYKTQMPLLFTLYGDISEKIARTLIAYCLATGRMPHRLLLDRRDPDAEEGQAKLLAEHLLVDAYYRGVDFDLRQAAAAIRRDALAEGRFEEYRRRGVARDIAHTIDLADGFNASRVLAEAAGDFELAAECERLSKLWPNAFNPITGLLNEQSRFYEGSHYNYSFRLMHDMRSRLKLLGGDERGQKQRYAEMLDDFFGFTDHDDEFTRFEGFNNETDMETPYAYFYANRHDRVCEVISAGMRSMFAEGRGGLPGNNDSGGLSSLYVWNAIGVFPVSGQDLMLIGTPGLKRAKMRLANGKTFTVEREGEGIYVERATLNGVELSEYAFKASDMMRGGVLKLFMQLTP